MRWLGGAAAAGDPGGRPERFRVAAKNPFTFPAEVAIELRVPDGSLVNAMVQARRCAPRDWVELDYVVTPPPGKSDRRVRLAADLTVEGRRFGQHAEAVVDLLP